MHRSNLRLWDWVMGFGIVASTALCPRLATADVGDQAAANALFDEGKRLMEKGQYAEACPKFQDSQRLDPGVGTMLNLARCFEKSGKTASAWSMFRDAAAAARDKGQAERERAAREEAKRLEPNVRRVVITVAAQPSSSAIELSLDGTKLPSSLWSVGVPVDPGTHTLSVSAPGKKTWTGNFEANKASSQVTVPVLEDAPVEAPSGAAVPAVPPEPMAPKATAPTPLAPEPSASSPGHGQRLAAIVVGGVGIAGVAVGSIFGLMVKPEYNKSAPFCNGDHCSDQGLSYRQSAFDKASISTIAFAVGGAGLVGGAVLWLSAPSNPEHNPGVALRAGVDPSGARIAVGGAFE
ncbi:MAG TPA: hypothetical protein VNW92_25880 [Polyangiaceae bacterium]|jgi:hypothetical protein|nr:hypothetical protein [Polyangiaceae bacterium]